MMTSSAHMLFPGRPVDFFVFKVDELSTVQSMRLALALLFITRCFGRVHGALNLVVDLTLTEVLFQG